MACVEKRLSGRLLLATSRVRVTRVAIVALAVCTFSAPVASQGTERSGKEVVAANCAACHGQGANGAPKIGDNKAWAKLSAQGLTSLTRTALEGIRKMPPHGGNPGLTDTEIARAVTYMVNQSGGHWTEPISRTTRIADRSGQQIVEERCAKCHRAGEGGAPRIGDRADWIPRLKQGLDVVVRSAIQGHGAMAARGGQADLTDAELRAAIVYMMNPGPGQAKATAASTVAGGQDYRVIDGTTVYFGAVATDAIRRNPKEYPAKLYGVPPVGPDQMYLTIALFDVNTGKRITDAAVRARVSTATAAGPEKAMEPVAMADAYTFGNYFAMAGTGPYEIAVRITRPGAPVPIQARFAYAR